MQLFRLLFLVITFTYLVPHITTTFISFVFHLPHLGPHTHTHPPTLPHPPPHHMPALTHYRTWDRFWLWFAIYLYPPFLHITTVTNPTLFLLCLFPQRFVTVLGLRPHGLRCRCRGYGYADADARARTPRTTHAQRLLRENRCHFAHRHTRAPHTTPCGALLRVPA